MRSNVRETGRHDLVNLDVEHRDARLHFCKTRFRVVGRRDENAFIA